MINVKSVTAKIIREQNKKMIDEKSNNNNNNNPIIAKNIKPVTVMVERFVQSLSNANDSGSFDTSLEVKTIIQNNNHNNDTKNLQNGIRRRRSKCVTELDREDLLRFVKQFEENNKENLKNQKHQKHEKSPKIDENFFKKQKIYDNDGISSLSSSTSSASSSSTPPSTLASRKNSIVSDDLNVIRRKNDNQRKISNDSGILPPESISTDSDFESTDQDFFEEEEEGKDNEKNIDENLLKTPQPLCNDNNNCRESNFSKIPNADDKISKTCRVLQFISSAKKKMKSFKSSSCNASPIPVRHRMNTLGVDRFKYNFDNEFDNNNNNNKDDGDVDDQHRDPDNISADSLTDSRNISPDSSFEFHPPILPMYKLTPPPSSAAHELAKILRGSFHVRKASVTTLRRSISDPDKYDLNKLKTTATTSTNDRSSANSIGKIKNDFIEPRNSMRNGIGAAVIRNLDIICSRALPSSSSSPFRRWGQSSFRTSKTTDPRQSLSRRPSSLAASETDVYSKSMDEDIDNINNCYHSYNNNTDELLSGQLIKNSNNNQNKFYNNYHHQNNNIQYQINNKHHQQLQQQQHQQQQQQLQQQHNHQNYQHHNAHNNQDSNEFNNNGSSNVAEWGTSFEKLLEDSSGLHTFAEFLKKEFSAENIYFWTACERYRQIDSHTERSIQAMQIFSKHLATKASEPVNVDSQARNITEDNLKAAEKNLFSQSQKQIFNLMKFDSYQRFIRSDLYKKCLEAETKNQPLPYPGDQLDELLRTTINPTGSSRLKKSASNAEDRRRKSLLPWHRKTRCKSRDRNECDLQSSKSSAKSQSSGNSLKLPTANSASDIHSSRSSLSSFDATVAASIGSGSDDSKACSLCRVILCDGATTIVQTRPDETIKQLIDRLLEKRGIHYQFFDVILSGQTKSIDLENPATILAGKEVQIEQRVAFKLDLPDPKVISVKSKPKKVLCEVLKPILHKYNYRLDDVQVLIRDTHEELDMSLPVTEIDGQRLQVVLLKSEDWKQDPLQQQKQSRLTYGSSALSYKNQQQQQQQLLTKNAPISSKSVKVTTQQTTLDEITNKVFNELLQGKVESHGNQCSMPKASDRSSLKSDDCASESSSIFERLRHRDSSIPGLKGLKPKKLGIMPSKSSVGSEDGFSTSTQITNGSDLTNNGIKKPLIAKWKAGVKLQVPGRTENHEEFLEGLKRAQRARLEDQRGTEINSELPDFLKDKENFNAACKLRKTRANLSPIGGLNTPRIPVIGASSNDPIVPPISPRNNFEINSNILAERPQPAPRLSITKMNQDNNNASPSKSDQNSPNEIENSTTIPSIMNNSSSSSSGSSNITNSYGNRNEMILNNSNGGESMNSGNEFENDISSKGPPPLPPKPKVLPMKPSNWGQGPATGNGNNPNGTTTTITNTSPPSRIPIDTSRRHLTLDQNSSRNVYLDQPSSSFV